MYSVTAASRLSGVPPDTLRAWERRYELVQPRRDDCGRRAYSEQDVTRLRLLRLATELGHPIRHLADLGVDELRTMVERGDAQSLPGDGMPRLVERLLGAVTQYAADECDEILGLAATLLDVDQLVDGVLEPLLLEADRRRRRGELALVQERMLHAAVSRTACAMLATFRRRARGPVMLLATLERERGEMGLLLSGLLAARDGAHCLHLGGDIPPEELVTAARHTGARCLVLGVAGGAECAALCRELDTLAQDLPEDCEVWLCGPCGDGVASARLPPRCTVLADAGALRRQLQAMQQQ
jgi:DNA-binding transcriptional MerR regulator